MKEGMTTIVRRHAQKAEGLFEVIVTKIVQVDRTARISFDNICSIDAVRIRETLDPAAKTKIKNKIICS